MKDKDKWNISIGWDILDFIILGFLPGVGTVFDMIGTVLAFKLWGNPGLIAFWEVPEVTEQIDRFIPSVTIAGLIAKKKFKI